MKNFKPLYRDINKLLRKSSFFDPFERMFFTRNFVFGNLENFDKPYPSRKQIFNKEKKPNEATEKSEKSEAQVASKDNKEPRNFSWEETREVFTPFGKKNIKTKVEEKEVKNDNFHSYSYSKTTSSVFHPWDSVENTKETKEAKDEKPKETKAAASNEKLPDNVEEIEKQEKIVFENGKKKRIITTKKTMKDGSITTEINEKYI